MSRIIFQLFFPSVSVETARIQRETAAIDSRLEEHSRVVSELRRLQVRIFAQVSVLRF